MLSKAQLRELEKRIKERFLVFRNSVSGERTLTSEEIKLLKEAGILRPSVTTFTGDAYALGKVVSAIKDKARSMELDEILAQATKIPTTDVEERAIEWSDENVGEYIKGIEADMIRDIRTGAIRSMADALRLVRNGVSETIKNRETVSELRTKLFEIVDDKYRDWQRVAFTEMNNAIQNGIHDGIRDAHGPDALVYKMPNPDACFEPGTKILTKRGNINIEDVVVGDEVLTHKFRWKKVSHLHVNHYEDVMININGVCATKKHPFLANMQWKSADSLNRGDQIIQVIGRAYSDNNKIVFNQNSFLCSIPMFCDFRRVMPIPSINLYGDLFRRNSNIDIISLDSKFQYWIKFFQFVKDEQLVCGGKFGLTFFGFSLLAQCLWSYCQQTCLSSIFRKIYLFCFSHFRKFQLMCLRNSSRSIISFQNFFNITMANIKFFSSFKNSISFLIKRTNKIVCWHKNSWHNIISFEIGFINEMTLKQYSGKVYNFSVEDDESYIAGGIVVHNCKWCKKLHLKEDGITPRIFKLSELEQNNIGKKSNEWTVVVDSTHPWCQCQLHVLPDGFTFEVNEEGKAELKYTEKKPKIEGIQKSNFSDEEQEYFFKY